MQSQTSLKLIIDKIVLKRRLRRKNLLFSIVILNYNTFQETLSCINSFVKIKNQDNIVLKFVIVDNNSPDGSGSLLKTHYEYDESVNVFTL